MTVNYIFKKCTKHSYVQLPVLEMKLLENKTVFGYDKELVIIEKRSQLIKAGCAFTNG